MEQQQQNDTGCFALLVIMAISAFFPIGGAIIYFFGCINGHTTGTKAAGFVTAIFLLVYVITLGGG